jgi:competence protein ComGF
MWYNFFNNKKRKKQLAKEAVLKEFFNFSDQKKAVAKAARESAKDQRVLVEKYRQLAKIGQ